MNCWQHAQVIELIIWHLLRRILFAHYHYNRMTVHFIDHEWRFQKRKLSAQTCISSFWWFMHWRWDNSCVAQWTFDAVFSIAFENVSSNNHVVSMLRPNLIQRRIFLIMVHFFIMDLIFDIIGKLCYVKQSLRCKKKFFLIDRSLNLDNIWKKLSW